MRRVVVEANLDGTAVAVGQRDGHEVWMLSPTATPAELADGCNEIIDLMRQQPLTWHDRWRLVKAATFRRRGVYICTGD